MKRALLSLLLSCMVTSGWAQPVVNDAYYVEPYVTGFQNVNAIAFSPGGAFGYEGQLFVGDARPSPGTIYRVPGPQEKVFFCSAASTEPKSLEFPPPGSAFDGYLYVMESYAIETYAADGTRRQLSRTNPFGMDLAFGPDATFGDYLFHSDPAGRAVREWTADGAQDVLVGGFPVDCVGLAFGPGGEWGSNLYVSFGPVDSTGGSSYIRYVTPEGEMADFLISEALGNANQLAFDTTGIFGGSLFVSDWEKDVIWEVRPDASLSVFAEGFLFSKTPYRRSEGGDIVFGPDGAMYVADGGAGTVWRIAPVVGEVQTLEITGPGEIAANGSARYSAFASFEDGLVVDVSRRTAWWVEPQGACTIDETGLLTAGDVDKPERVTVVAHYVRGDVAVEARANVTLVPTCGGGALWFDGQKDFVRVPRSESLEPGEITVELWAFMEGEQQYHTRLVRKCGDFGNGYILAVNQSYDRRMQLRIDFGIERIADVRDNREYTGQWHHFAGVYGVSSAAFYVDGVQVASKSHNAGPVRHNPLTDLFIGWGGVGAEYFSGMIDEVRIWNVPRTAEEIRENFQRRLVGDEPGLAAYWTFDEGEGQIVNDLSPYGNDGFLGTDPDAADESDPVWVESDAPIMGCTTGELIRRNINEALRIKQRILEDLEKVKAKELATEQLLRELQKEGADDLSKKEVIQLRMNLVIAIIRELQSTKSLTDSVAKLQAMMDVLDEAYQPGRKGKHGGHNGVSLGRQRNDRSAPEPSGRSSEPHRRR